MKEDNVVVDKSKAFAIRGQSRADFAAKLNIALKESSEAEYWLELLHETGYISQIEFKDIYKDCSELIKLLTSIIKTTRSNSQL